MKIKPMGIIVPIACGTVVGVLIEQHEYGMAAALFTTVLLMAIWDEQNVTDAIKNAFPFDEDEDDRTENKPNP